MTTNTFNNSEIINTKEAVNYSEGSIVSRIVRKNSSGNVTLFAFDKGQVLSEHTAPYDAIVQVLDGETDITIDGKTHRLKEGQFIIMPANIPHGLEAASKFKMMLTMIKGI